MLLYFLLARFRLYTLPDVIAPNQNIFTSWQFVSYWAEVIWLILDAGTGIAAIRYFASLRVRHPRRAFSYFQFYIWWQLFVGAAQFSIVALLSAVVFPRVNFAHLTYFILMQSIIRFPGFLTIFILFFRAIQRLDYEQYLIFFLTYGSAALQILAYIIFTMWEPAQNLIGQNQTRMVGLGAGLYAATWIIFILGLFLYHRQGYNIKTLFLPISDTQVSRQHLSFGIRAAFGTLAIPLGALIQLYILDNVLPELNSSWRIWFIAVQIATIFELLLQQFYRNMIPALTEAIALNYKTLLRYYVTQGIRYGMWLSVFILAVFVASGQNIIDIILPEAPLPVLEILLLLLTVSVFRWGGWLIDALLLASERPGLSSVIIILEQILTIGGGVFLASRWGILGFLSAYAISFLVRMLVSWIIMQRLIIHVHIYIWQTLVSPLISGMLIYYLLHAILLQIMPLWHTGFAFVAILIGLWIYAFLTALFGGWDDANIREFGRAVKLSGIGKPYAWGMWQCIRLGARISPLHGRFPVLIAGIAEEQAIAITYTRSASK
jgi:O-antigen/teichoic acid export membrane protein